MRQENCLCDIFVLSWSVVFMVVPKPGDFGIVGHTMFTDSIASHEVCLAISAIIKIISQRLFHRCLEL